MLIMVTENYVEHAVSGGSSSSSREDSSSDGDDDVFTAFVSAISQREQRRSILSDYVIFRCYTCTWEDIGRPS